MYIYKYTIKGPIQDFLIGGSNVHLLILPDNLFILPFFLKILHENEITVSKGGVPVI